MKPSPSLYHIVGGGLSPSFPTPSISSRKFTSVYIYPLCFMQKTHYLELIGLVFWESSAALPNRRGPSRGPVAFPGGKKRLITTNELGQPNGSDVDSMAFKTAIGVNTRKYIPIAYTTFHLVDPEYYEKVLGVLQENFDCEGVFAEYLRDRVNQAWKNHRHNLHKKYIKGKPVAVVRNSPPPPFVNREEWQWFVDYTSKERRI